MRNVDLSFDLSLSVFSEACRNLIFAISVHHWKGQNVRVLGGPKQLSDTIA